MVVSIDSMIVAGRVVDSLDSLDSLLCKNPKVSVARLVHCACLDLGLMSDISMIDLRSDSYNCRLMPLTRHLNCAQSHLDISVNTLNDRVSPTD